MTTKIYKLFDNIYDDIHETKTAAYLRALAV